MNNSNVTEPMIPTMESNSDLKDYHCPHCDKFLFKGNIQRLNMVCHHCQKLITADEDELFRPDTEFKE
jgi:acetyl-CoA carboxylase beta subunit